MKFFSPLICLGVGVLATEPETTTNFEIETEEVLVGDEEISSVAATVDSVDILSAATIYSGTACTGKRLGQYTWSTKLWKQGSRELVDFFGSQDGRDWGCGDVTINIGDYTAPRSIFYKDDIIPFIQAYRATSGNYESVVWLSYGDTVSKDGSRMETFTQTFFDWIETIPQDVSITLGTIGLSFDVEKMPAASTESGLIKAQALKAQSSFPAGKLLIQHTIEGKRNPDGTDFVMKYADSALVMIYRNYMTSPTMSESSNILSRARFFLKEQCVYCLDDAYAAANYKAKITMMVEASCGPMDYCAKLSFCAHDAPGEGALYMWDTLMELESGMVSSGLVNPSQFQRLMNPVTTYAVHDWKWFQCFEPMTYGASSAQCAQYPTTAEQCRKTKGELNTTPKP